MKNISLHESFKTYLKNNLKSQLDFRPIIAWCVLNHKDTTFIYEFISSHRTASINKGTVGRWRRETQDWLGLPPKGSGPLNSEILETQWRSWREKHGSPSLDELVDGWSPHSNQKTSPIAQNSSKNKPSSGSYIRKPQTEQNKPKTEIDNLGKVSDEEMLSQITITNKTS